MGRIIAELESELLPKAKSEPEKSRAGQARSSLVLPPVKAVVSTVQDRMNPGMEFVGHAGALNLFVARDLALVSDEWRAFQSSACYSPFQDVDWNSAWLQSAGAGQGYQPLIVFGYDEKQLRFILPLALVRKFGLCRLTWLAQSINDYNAPLLDPEFAEQCSLELVAEIWKVVVEAHGQIDLADFRQQPDKIAGRANPFIGEKVQPSSCNAHLINLRPDWRSFFEEMRTAKSRKRLRDKEKRLSRLGELQFRCEKDPTARRRLIKQALQWKLVQLSASGDHHPFSPDTKDAEAGSTVERTLLTLCNLPEMRHKLRVEGLYISGEPVALIVAMVTGDQYSVFITAHSGGASSQYSPGKILLVKTIQLVCRTGCRKFDLLAGDEDYKLSWCDETVHLWSRAFGLSLMGKAAVPAIRAARSAKKKLKQSPRLLEIAKSLNKRRLLLS